MVIIIIVVVVVVGVVVGIVGILLVRQRFVVEVLAVILWRCVFPTSSSSRFSIAYLYMHGSTQPLFQCPPVVRNMDGCENLSDTND